MTPASETEPVALLAHVKAEHSADDKALLCCFEAGVRYGAEEKAELLALMKEATNAYGWELEEFASWQEDARAVSKPDCRKCGHGWSQHNPSYVIHPRCLWWDANGHCNCDGYEPKEDTHGTDRPASTEQPSRPGPGLGTVEDVARRELVDIGVKVAEGATDILRRIAEIRQTMDAHAEHMKQYARGEGT